MEDLYCETTKTGVPFEHDSFNHSNFSMEFEFPPVGRSISREEVYFHQIRHYCYNIVLPIIFAVGIIGNILNIIVLSKSRFRHALDEIEKSAVTGLVSLAVSDLIFCFLGALTPLLSFSLYHGGDDKTKTWMDVAALYYNTYKGPLMNVFLLSSTWLIVAVSLERYVAVCYPFHARWLIRIKRTVIIDSSIYGVAIIFNLPAFLKYKIYKYTCPNGSSSYVVLVNEKLLRDGTVLEIYRISWAIFGTFVPLIVLACCNIRLLWALYKSRTRLLSENEPARRYKASKITTILLAVILLYLFLVCPSMVLGCLRHQMADMKEITYYRYSYVASTLFLYL